MSLLDKMLKAGSVKGSSVLSKSNFFQAKDPIKTDLPIVNIAFSGSLNGGLIPGLTVLAGVSKSFKTLLGLYCMKAYLDKYKDGVAILYDSEYGITPDYLESFDIDIDRVIHVPLEDIEQLKFDLTRRLDEVSKGDRVMIMIDSIGNLASKKEVDDALDGKSVADMSRAKQMKSLFRIVTPHLNLKDIPLICVNHTYKEIGLFPKDIVSGGTGAYYSADAIWIIGRRQEKEGTEIKGYHFVVNIEKSRHVREKSQIPITVTFDGGIMKWSGLLEVAEKAGYVHKPKVGWYEALNPETGEVLSDKMMRAKEIVDNKDFWLMMFEKTNLAKHIEKVYTIASSAGLISDDSQIEIADEEIVAND